MSVPVACLQVGCLVLMTTFSASMLAIKKLYSSGAILFITLNTLLWWFKGCACCPASPAACAALPRTRGPPPQQQSL